MKRRGDRWCTRTALAVLLGFGTAACAAEEARVLTWQALPEAPRHGDFVGEPGVAIEVMTEGFMAAHPDLRWRREGLHDYANGRHAQAMTHFLQAARYADKASQAMVAEMHWQGIGVPQDRALGYAWMDLAAERHYPNFLILRERYWSLLDEATRAEAIERGQRVYAEYGDELAKPRLEKVLRREKRKLTGSRTGFVGNITIIPNTGPLAGAGMSIPGERFYAKEYWEPERYWALQDTIWKSPPRGEVHVGDLVPGADATKD
jgi:hypothetical protein